MNLRNAWAIAGIGASAAVFAGCASGGTGEVQLGISVSNAQTTEGLAATEAKAAAGLEVTRVRILVNVVKIGYAGGGKSRGHGPDDEASDSTASDPTALADGEASTGPVVVELTKDELTKGAERSFSLGELAAGTYGGAEIEIDQLDDGTDASAAELADFANENASVLIDGTFNGTAFHVAGHFLAEQGTDGEVTIDGAAPVTLDLSIDPTTWFLDDAGEVIDPTDAANHAAIALGICKALDTQPQLSDKAGPEAHCVESP